MAATTTVRARRETWLKLKDLSERTGRSVPDLLAQSVALLERDSLLDEANAAFAATRADPAAWRAELEERRGWDVTLEDDLESE
jgi:hypothetical protein